MRVLVLEDEYRAGAGSEEQLVAAGHTVLRCHDRSAPPFPCAGMPGGDGCPIEHGGVDVALSVRRGSDAPSVAEDGMRCALRQHVPVVLAGSAGQAPWAAMATVVEPALSEVVAAVERAASEPLARHSRVATDTLRAALARAEVDTAGCEAVVRRYEGGLRVVLVTPTEIDSKLAHAAGVRVAAALRLLDDKSTAVDVVLEPLGS